MKFNSELRCAHLTIEQIHAFSEDEIPDGENIIYLPTQYII